MNEKGVKRDRVTWPTVAAIVCFVGSVLSLAIGFVLTTGWVVNAHRHPLLHGVGLTLLIVGFPLLILGGYYLDLIEEREKSWRQNLNA